MINTTGQLSEIEPDRQLRRKYNSIWRNMLARCTDKTHSHYHRYGARGISVAEEIASLPNFLRYIKTLENYGMCGLFLDRIDNDSGYSPGNLRFVTPAESALNKAGSRVIFYKDEHLSMEEFRAKHAPSASRRVIQHWWGRDGLTAEEMVVRAQTYKPQADRAATQPLAWNGQPINWEEFRRAHLPGISLNTVHWWYYRKGLSLEEMVAHAKENFIGGRMGVRRRIRRHQSKQSTGIGITK